MPFHQLSIWAEKTDDLHYFLLTQVRSTSCLPLSLTHCTKPLQCIVADICRCSSCCLERIQTQIRIQLKTKLEYNFNSSHCNALLFSSSSSNSESVSSREKQSAAEAAAAIWWNRSCCFERIQTQIRVQLRFEYTWSISSCGSGDLSSRNNVVKQHLLFSTDTIGFTRSCAECYL